MCSSAFIHSDICFWMAPFLKQYSVMLAYFLNVRYILDLGDSACWAKMSNMTFIDVDPCYQNETIEKIILCDPDQHFKGQNCKYLTKLFLQICFHLYLPSSCSYFLQSNSSCSFFFACCHGAFWYTSGAVSYTLLPACGIQLFFWLTMYTQQTANRKKGNTVQSTSQRIHYVNKSGRGDSPSGQQHEQVEQVDDHHLLEAAELMLR